MNPKTWILNAITPRVSSSEHEDIVMRHLAQVSDQDHCLLAVREMLSGHLLQSVAIAGSHHSDDTQKLRACERMECFRMLLAEIEQRREEAKAWREKQATG